MNDLHNYGKSPFLMGQLTISMIMFNMLNDQRVLSCWVLNYRVLQITIYMNTLSTNQIWSISSHVLLGKDSVLPLNMDQHAILLLQAGCFPPVASSRLDHPWHPWGAVLNSCCWWSTFKKGHEWNPLVTQNGLQGFILVLKMGLEPQSHLPPLRHSGAYLSMVKTWPIQTVLGENVSHAMNGFWWHGTDKHVP